MKLGIIGVGVVGSATAMAVVLRARVRERVLIDKDRARARAVATDKHYGVPLSVQHLSHGDVRFFDARDIEATGQSNDPFVAPGSQDQGNCRSVGNAR